MAVFELQQLSEKRRGVDCVSKQQDEKVQSRGYGQQNHQAVDHKGIQQCGVPLEGIGAESESLKSGESAQLNKQSQSVHLHVRAILF